MSSAEATAPAAVIPAKEPNQLDASSRRHSRESGNPVSFVRYAGYKDSGVAWLGSIPAHWNVLPIKGLVSTPVTDGPHETPEFFDAGIPFVSAEAVSGGKLDFSKIRGYISRTDHERYGQKYLPRRGDVYMVKSGATTGVTAIVETDAEFNIWSPLAAIRCGEDIRPRFLLHYMRSRNFLDGVTLGWSFGTQQNIGMNVIENLAVPVPPRAEQEAILGFLDRETGKIDALVAEQEKLIALLKEKRQALISHAVTKGLNPDAPMKPSGIDWLGDVPANWDVVQIKRLTQVQRGASPRPIEDPKFFDDNGQYAWVRIADVSASDGQLRETPQRLSDLGSSLSVKLAPGSLFISIAGTVGKPCITQIDACIHDGFVYFPTLQLNPMFLYRVFEAGLCYAGLGKFGTQLNLNTDTIGAIRVALPPRRELEDLLMDIERTTASTDALIGEAAHAVDLLKERRAALISAAVTGKIDVRSVIAIACSAHPMPMPRAIRWAEPRQACSDWDCAPDSVVWISIAKLDAAWKHDTDAYIGAGGTGAAIEGRYDQFGKWLMSTAESVELPVVSFDDDGSVGFTDGRHRFAWLRDHGTTSMPVQVPADQAPEFEARFGTTDSAADR